jgi:inner membrane protein
MHLPNHLAIGWLTGHREPSRRARMLIAWSSVAPDLDTLAIVFGQDAFGRWHHVLCHGILFALVVTAVVFALTRSARVASLAFVSFHLHLIADLLGSGREWSMSYLYPLSDWQLGITWGWELASWQNSAIMVGLFAAMIVTARRSDRTFAEAFLPARIDREVARTVKRWFA